MGKTRSSQWHFDNSKRKSMAIGVGGAPRNRFIFSSFYNSLHTMVSIWPRPMRVKKYAEDIKCFLLVH